MTILTITYSGLEATAADIRLTLEQQPVATNRLTLTDLEQMLAMVGGGIPARLYDQPTCSATVVQGEVRVDLAVWAWPSSLDLAYSLTTTLGELGNPVRIEMEREFDLVLNFSERVDLPFLALDLSWEWTNMPCFNRIGAEIDRPQLIATPTAILNRGDFLGVIRVRCRAVGYQHPVTVRLRKTDAVAITDVAASVMAAWSDSSGATATTALDLKLPRCVEQLLETCPGGGLQREEHYGTVEDDRDGYPVVYYNTCNGQVLAVRYER